ETIKSCATGQSKWVKQDRCLVPLATKKVAIAVRAVACSAAIHFLEGARRTRVSDEMKRIIWGETGTPRRARRVVANRTHCAGSSWLRSICPGAGRPV